MDSIYGLMIFPLCRSTMAALCILVACNCSLAFGQTDAPSWICKSEHDLVSGCISTDGVSLVVGTTNGVIEVWDLSRRERVSTWEAHSSAVLSLAISADKSSILSEGADRRVKSWKLDSGRLAWEASDPSGTELLNEAPWSHGRVAFVDSDTMVACFGWLWDAKTGTKKERLGIRGVVASGKDYLATRQLRGYAVFDAKTKQEKRRYRDNALQCMAICPNEKIIAVGRAVYGGGLDIYELESGRKYKAQSNLKGWILDVAFSPDGKELAIAEFKQGITVLNTESFETLRKVDCTENFDVHYSSDGKYFVALGGGKAIKIWKRGD